MNLSANSSECAPLIEACTLDLYKKNIFRVTGLPVDATSKEVARQVQKLQMLEEMSGGTTGVQPAFSLTVPPTPDEIREALTRMKDPEQRLVDEFFWYWPEKFGASKEDPAIQAMLAGNAEGAFKLWKEREKNGSYVAQHNMAVMYHMYAVDWTHYQNHAEKDEALDDSVKGYWRDSFRRWEPLIDADELWDMLKERVRSLGDEALTTGFVRRMLKQLPVALDRVNAEAALKMAEQGRIDWARFHVDFMSETHPGLDDVDSTAELVLAPTKSRVEQHLESFRSQSLKNPKLGADLANQLLDGCRPMMDLFDLFHGAEAHQRNELFDSVAKTVLDMAITGQKATQDNKTAVALLKRCMNYASGSNLRERLMTNLGVLEGMVANDSLKPIFSVLDKIQNSSGKASSKLLRLKDEVIGQLPSWSSRLGSHSEAYMNLEDSVAIALRNISIDAHNGESDTNTAIDAIRIALKLVNDESIANRIQGDLKSLQEILSQRKKWNRTIAIRSDEFEINEEFVRYNATRIPADKITHIKFGIFKKIVNGIESSYYNIGLSGGGQSIAVDCKRVFRSEEQARQDFMAIVESLAQIIIPKIVNKLVSYLKSGGNNFMVGPIVLKSDGIECDTGLLAWKKKHHVPYGNLHFSTYQGLLQVSVGKPADTSFSLDRRTTYNAVILEGIVDEMKKR